MKLVPDYALLHTSLSKALLKARQRDAAFAEQAKADTLINDTGDREQRICYAWSWHVRGLKAKGKDAQAAFDHERGILDYAITVYRDDVDLWAAQGDAAESPLPRRRSASSCSSSTQPHAGEGVEEAADRPQPQVRCAGSDGQRTARRSRSSLTGWAISTSRSPPAIRWRRNTSTRGCAVLTPTSRQATSRTAPHNASSTTLQLDPKCAMAQWGLSSHRAERQGQCVADCQERLCAVAFERHRQGAPLLRSRGCLSWRDRLLEHLPRYAGRCHIRLSRRDSSCGSGGARSTATTAPADRRLR